MSATSGDTGKPELSRAAEDLLYACFDAEDVDEAVERACAANPAIAKKIRAVYARLRELGLTPGGVEAQQETASRILPGQRMPPEVASLEIQERIGEGGMGVVFRAWSASLGREVAIKFIHPRLVHLAGKRLRFQREIEAIARLSHPNIIPVLEVGETDGIPWFTMDYVAGSSLGEILKALRDVEASGLSASTFFAASSDKPETSAPVTDRQLGRTWNDACLEITIQVARALEHAHARGVLHRDVKPSNIMVTPDGRALLLDFGLARTEEEDELALTRSTSEIGSLPYMAPELLRGGAIPNPRLDVYGLGVTLYEILTRENPFLDNTAERTRARVLEGNAKPPRKIRPQIPWDLETVCLTAMAPESERRYANMSALLGDLERLQKKLPIRAKRAGVFLRMRRWQQRHPVLSAGLLTALVLLAIGSFVLMLQERRARDNAERLERLAQRQTLRAERMLHGTQLAFARALLLARNPSNARRALERIAPSERGWVWHHLERMADMAAVRRRLYPQQFDFVVLPDEQRMLTSDGKSDVFLVDLESGAKERLELPSLAQPDLSADGRAVVGAIPASGELLVYEIEERRVRARFDAGAFTRSPRFVEGHEQLAAMSPSGEIRFWKLGATGAEVLRTWKVFAPRKREPVSFFFRDRARTQLYTIQALDGLKLWSREGELLATVPNEHAPIASARVTADGEKLVLAHSSYFTPSRRRITAWETDEHTELWSIRPEIRAGVLAVEPSGSRVAFGNRSLFLLSTKTRDAVAHLVGHIDAVEQVEWLSDGRIVSSDMGGYYRLWRPDALPHSRKYFAHESSVTAIHVVADGEHVVSGSSGGDLTLASSQSYEKLHRAQLPAARVQAIHGGSADEVVIVLQDGSVHVRSARDLGELRKTSIGERAAQATRVDDTRTLVLAESGLLFLVDHRTGQQSKRRVGRADWSTLAYANGALVLGSPTGTMQFWRIQLNGVSLAEVREPSASLVLDGEKFVSSVVTEDGERAFVGTAKGSLFWVDTATGAIQRRFRGHGAHPGQLRVGRQSGRLFSVAWNATFMAWHHELEEALLFVSPGRAMLLSLGVHPRGDFVAVGGIDGNVQLLWGKPRDR